MMEKSPCVSSLLIKIGLSWSILGNFRQGFLFQSHIHDKNDQLLADWPADYCQLITDGKVRLEEDSASLYLPEWKVPDKQAITIKHLLRMESGLSTGASYQTGIPWLFQMHLGTDILYYISHLSATGLPGQQFEYNNMNAQALGLIIQNASGRRHSEFLSDKLWTKIGASDASVWLDRKNGIARTYCCLYSRPRDWVRVGFLLMNHGLVGRQQLVSKKWIDQMLKPSPFEPEYGYSIWLGNSRGHFKREKHDRSEDFIVKDLFFLDGRGERFRFCVTDGYITMT